MTSYGDDPIPTARTGSVNLVEALSNAQHLPVEAIDLAVQRPARVADAVLSVVALAADGAELSAKERNLLFWGIHVLAQVRDTRLARPLLRLLRRPGEALFELLGEVVDTTLPKIVASVFDGDATVLEEVLADRDADELVRWRLFAAYAFLVQDGRIDRERARGFLIRFDDDRLARSGDAAWSGWEEAIALLGFRDLEPRRAAALAGARLLAEDGADDGFAALLALAEAEPTDWSRFTELGLGYLDDAAAELDVALAPDDDAPAEEPVRNPLRDVGRNDPCPCGSGRKYKKCCLKAA